jgi:hypothetical protein
MALAACVFIALLSAGQVASALKEHALPAAAKEEGAEAAGVDAKTKDEFYSWAHEMGDTEKVVNDLKAKKLPNPKRITAAKAKEWAGDVGESLLNMVKVNWTKTVDKVLPLLGHNEKETESSKSPALEFSKQAAGGSSEADSGANQFLTADLKQARVGFERYLEEQKRASARERALLRQEREQLESQRPIVEEEKRKTRRFLKEQLDKINQEKYEREHAREILQEQIRKEQEKVQQKKHEAKLKAKNVQKWSKYAADHVLKSEKGEPCPENYQVVTDKSLCSAMATLFEEPTDMTDVKMPNLLPGCLVQPAKKQVIFNTPSEGGKGYLDSEYELVCATPDRKVRTEERRKHDESVMRSEGTEETTREGRRAVAERKFANEVKAGQAKANSDIEVTEATTTDDELKRQVAEAKEALLKKKKFARKAAQGAKDVFRETGTKEKSWKASPAY